MKFRWSVAPLQPLLTAQLARSLKISELLAQCLINRGLSDPEQIAAFLDPKLKNLADPFLLPNMDAAVTRLLKAREQQESLVIFGDYDVDGVTSTAILAEVLGRLGWKVASYLPNRMEEGYGLSADAVENCLRRHPASILLAVDCGSTSHDVIASLSARGIDVIVLDHHQLVDPLPPAVALVNPQLQNHSSVGTGEPSRAKSPAPFCELCSAGLAFKLAHALLKRGREAGLPGAADFDLRPLLDLAALGTIADLVPLTGENRILVSAGLQWLNRTTRPGLIALKTVAQISGVVGTYETAFQLAPRLNAAGRLETAEESLRLLQARDLDEATPIAERLDARNRERQRIEKDIAEEVIGSIRARFNPETDYVIVEGQLLWHIGVVGIVASRVLQEFYRPTIIVGGDGSDWRGSGRSITGFDLAGALKECGDLLVKHGGHAMAAGLTIQAANLGALRERLNDLARRALKPDDLLAPLRIDAEIRLRDLDLRQLSELDRLRPTGQGNPAVQFSARNLTHQRPLQRVGANKQHVKMWVTDGASTCEAVWWGAGNGTLPVGQFDLAFSPQINSYNGRESLQLKVLDWRPAEQPPSG